MKPVLVTNLFYDCEIIRIDATHARYDKKSFNIFDSFTRSGDGKTALKKLPAIEPDKVYPFYLCVTNDTRKKHRTLHRSFMSRWRRADFLPAKHETYKLSLGAPIICTKNNADLKKLGIANNWKGHLTYISSKRAQHSQSEVSYLMMLKDGLKENRQWRKKYFCHTFCLCMCRPATNIRAEE